MKFAIMAIRDRLAQLVEMESRRAAMIKSLEERNFLTDQLRSSVERATSNNALEDLYAPCRPQRWRCARETPTETS